MKIKPIISLLTLCTVLCSDVMGQTSSRKAENRINISGTPQLFFNKINIENDGKYPDPMTTKNTFGFTAGVEYQRITRHGLSLSYGIQFGQQSHDISMHYNLTNFDPQATKSLKSFTVSDIYGTRINYINQRLMIGYIKTLPWKNWNRWDVEARGGISDRFYLNGANQSRTYTIQYQGDDGTMYKKTFAENASSFGNGDAKTKIRYVSWSPSFEWYLGMRTDFVAGRFIKNFSIGLEMTKAIRNTETLIARSFDANYQQVSLDRYNSKDLSLGLRIAVGLWK